jgi:hypothetical protein
MPSPRSFWSLVLLVTAACSQGGSQPTEPAETSQAPGTESGLAAAPGGADTAAASGGGAPSGPTGDITNDPPDGGVVMNNATTSKDAGGSDRLRPIIDAITQNREKFRACFDEWGKQNPGREVRITLTIKLKASGELVSAAFKADESDLADKKMEECMAKAAGTLKFPESPKGMETTYNHRFNFKSHK